MAESHDRPPEPFTLRLRRYDPESGDAPYWDEHTIELEPHRSVLEAILQARDRFDGSIGIRCSCRQAICGSCGVRVNGDPALACHTHLDAARRGAADGVIEIEPMGNMPVLKDLIVDMDAVHWKKIKRVTPWLIAKQPVPEREYLVPRESMVDVTQTMACIQCGACVSDCLAMEVDPLFVGPAALAKAYRFVGDPRDDQHFARLNDLAQDPHGMFDCTHCFKCVDACPKDVNPMGQIMRLRRIATTDHHIVDQNNGERHEAAFTGLIRDNGILWEAELLPRSYGGPSWFGKFHPAAGKELLSSLPVAFRGLLRRKMTLPGILRPHKIPAGDLKAVQAIYDRVESREERYELNLYIVGEDEQPVPEVAVAAGFVEVSAPAGESITASSPPDHGTGNPAVTETTDHEPDPVDAGAGRSDAERSEDGGDETSEGSADR
ncbi:MAG TPA: succinate dehydrogenase/fumarate reductase iron-sulfur subunit [Solirubrobacteraceae bacterium]|jgi:succinate dehydrogenase / fumarate reductase iron-sulfur subunit|nr:succinate dehydrogenase/fumarate reductase iron-sulfur subunit [Solirubrobacteraceae bacterium]